MDSAPISQLVTPRQWPLTSVKLVMILSTIYGLITYDNLISNHKNNCWVYCRSDLFVLYGSLWKLFLAGAHHLLILLILADSTVWLKSTTFRIS